MAPEYRVAFCAEHDRRASAFRRAQGQVAETGVATHVAWARELATSERNPQRALHGEALPQEPFALREDLGGRTGGGEPRARARLRTGAQRARRGASPVGHTAGFPISRAAFDDVAYVECWWHGGSRSCGTCRRGTR